MDLVTRLDRNIVHDGYVTQQPRKESREDVDCEPCTDEEQGKRAEERYEDRFSCGILDCHHAEDDERDQRENVVDEGGSEDTSVASSAVGSRQQRVPRLAGLLHVDAGQF